MRILWLLIAASTMHACAQTPKELLQLAQDAYKNPGGYLINGRASVQLKGSPWQATSDLVLAAAPAPLETPNAPVVPVGHGGALHWNNVGNNLAGGSEEKPKSFATPFPVIGGWPRIAERVDTVKEIGTERLPLNGSPVDCRVLEVAYNAPETGPAIPPVKYSICSGQHLVLKKLIFYPTDRHDENSGAWWTVTWDTAQFNRPAPAWVLAMNSLPSLTIRKEWVGKQAPPFKLTDLDGNPVELASLRGKVVLLNFWSISCAPCVREMPSLEKFAEEHKDRMAFWGISIDQPDRAKKWLAQHNQQFPTLSDRQYATSDQYKVHGIPVTVLIGRKGKIRNYWDGDVPSSDLEAALAAAGKSR